MFIHGNQSERLSYAISNHSSALSTSPSALSKKNIRVNVPSTFTIGVSTDPDIMNNAAERLLGLDEHQINSQAKDIILGQMRLVIATLSIEEINQDREKFLDLVNKNVNFELNKIGLEMINVNIRDITDESGYIEALGQKAAAEAINKAKIDADAEAERIRRVAAGEADGILAKYKAEAEGTQRVLEAKSAGYERLLAACSDRKDIAPALLMIEQLPTLVAEQVKAIQNLKIEKITVWDGATGNNDASSATAGFLRGMIGALPPIHDLAKQAGIELPEALGRIEDTQDSDAGRKQARNKPPVPKNGK